MKDGISEGDPKPIQEEKKEKEEEGEEEKKEEEEEKECLRNNKVSKTCFILSVSVYMTRPELGFVGKLEFVNGYNEYRKKGNQRKTRLMMRSQKRAVSLHQS